MKKSVITFILASLCALAGFCQQRNFIAHRGVNLRSTIAGENSIEAIRLARKARFHAIETDVRLTSDDSLVVMHDATLNRTCLNADGTPLSEKVEIKDLTFAELENYRLKADSASMRSRIPLLRDYLAECRDNGIFTFIEPKLVDTTGVYYQRIIDLADEILGEGNYVVTSNNRANEIIRNTLGNKDVRLMGILYQSTFPAIEDLGNVIMAISASRIGEPAYSDYVALSKSKGLMTESHADKFEHFIRINANPIDYISTDFLAPDFSEEMKVVQNVVIPRFPIDLSVGQSIMLPVAGAPEFGGAYLAMAFSGKLEIEFCGMKLESESNPDLRFQVMTYGKKPYLKITASEPTEISRLELKTVDFK